MSKIDRNQAYSSIIYILGYMINTISLLGLRITRVGNFKNRLTVDQRKIRNYTPYIDLLEVRSK